MIGSTNDKAPLFLFSFAKGGMGTLLFFFLFIPPRVNGGEKHPGTEGPAPVAVIPFRQTADHIVLSVRLNGDDRHLSFLLDTGADGMAIRKTLADSLGLVTAKSRTAEVVGGRIEVDISTGNTVHLSENFSLEMQNIALFETVSGFDGIIGMNLIRRYVTEVNFDECNIYLFEHGYRPDDGKKRITLPVDMLGSLLLVPAGLNLTGDKTITGNFIMDTGAHYHLILFSRFVRKNRLLLSGFKPEGQASTVSMGHTTPVFYGKAHEFKAGEEIVLHDFPVVLQASSGGSGPEGDTPDGSVGIMFFNRFNFIIDVPAKRVYLEERTPESKR